MVSPLGPSGSDFCMESKNINRYEKYGEPPIEEVQPNQADDSENEAASETHEYVFVNVSDITPVPSPPPQAAQVPSSKLKGRQLLVSDLFFKPPPRPPSASSTDEYGES